MRGFGLLRLFGLMAGGMSGGIEDMKRRMEKGLEPPRFIKGKTVILSRRYWNSSAPKRQNGAREKARRMRQIAAGTLTASNGLAMGA